MIKSHVARNEKTHELTGKHAVSQSVLQTAGTSCAKIKDPNSNFAENNINLCLGYLKTYIQTQLLLCPWGAFETITYSWAPRINKCLYFGLEGGQVQQALGRWSQGASYSFPSAGRGLSQSMVGHDRGFCHKSKSCKTGSQAYMSSPCPNLPWQQGDTFPIMISINFRMSFTYWKYCFINKHA